MSGCDPATINLSILLQALALCVVTLYLQPFGTAAVSEPMHCFPQCVEELETCIKGCEVFVDRPPCCRMCGLKHVKCQVECIPSSECGQACGLTSLLCFNGCFSLSGKKLDKCNFECEMESRECLDSTCKTSRPKKYKAFKASDRKLF